MKKILIFVMAICSLSLFSCSKKSTDPDYAGVNVKIAKEWMDKVEYNSTTINEYAADLAHYEIYLPKDVNGSLKVNVGNIEALVSDKTLNVSVPFATGTNFSAAAKSEVAALYTEYFAKNDLDFGFDEKVASSWNTVIDLEKYPAVSGKDRVIYTVYMPTKLDGYITEKKDVKLAIKSYVLVPVFVGVAYDDKKTVEVELEGASSSITEMEKVEFNFSNGVLVD